MEYEGRMVCDGYGNLLADEGERKGDPIAYNEDGDNFVFLAPNDPSHNEQHHKQFALVVGTQASDPDLPGYAGPDAEHATEGNEHHWEENIDRSEPIRFHPDSVAAKISGHTHQHKVGA
jgi:hypothetical protein